MDIHPVLEKVTQGIIAKSCATRAAYLERVQQATQQNRVTRASLSCTNLAHAVAAMPSPAKLHLKELERPNIAIVSAYNDMLSAHQPLENFPAWIKDEALRAGATAQFAGGVPAMCDGVTQGQAGMELSLFSRFSLEISLPRQNTILLPDMGLNSKAQYLYRPTMVAKPRPPAGF